ncbi:MAG: hypothetical protein E6G31_06535 [Actinobacteria bacterium]|nr:MAG: hypothetical protein E6G31_06535 [Actinomycetota bacterium]
MKRSSIVFGLGLSVSLVTFVLLAPATAAGKRRPPPPPPPPPPPAWSTYVKNYAYALGGVRQSVTPEAVQTTSDGGSAALALVDGPSAASWVVKVDSFGLPQWQREVGCFDLPPGSYAYALSLDQTTDGGYAIGGGTRGCGSATICPHLGGLECALVEKLDATGQLVWARVYQQPGTTSTVVNQVTQTSDGGFIAVGSIANSGQNTGVLGALILKLDALGNVQWQRTLGQPGGPLDAYLNAVQQTADGGYVATGEFSPPSTCEFGCGQGVLVVKLDAQGSVTWERGFNSFDASGNPTASEHAFSIVQTSEGGYLVGGNWGNGTGPGTCCRGALLLKLDANGNSEWQKAFSGGVYCFFNGYSYQCYAIGADVRSLQQSPDGGYVLAGSGDLELLDSVPLVPWLAKVDASGNLLWQHFYYQSYPSTGRPLSEYFPSSDRAAGGYQALGFTENPTDGKGELFGVKTDASGLVGACSQVHPATPLNAIDPGLDQIAPTLPVQTTVAAQGDSSSSTRATSITASSGQC